MLVTFSLPETPVLCTRNVADDKVHERNGHPRRVDPAEPVAGNVQPTGVVLCGDTAAVNLIQRDGEVVTSIDLCPFCYDQVRHESWPHLTDIRISEYPLQGEADTAGKMLTWVDAPVEPGSPIPAEE